MKKKGLFLVSAVVAAIVGIFAFTGCSEDDNDVYVNMSWKPNEKVIEALRTTTTPIVFKSTGQTKDLTA